MENKTDLIERLRKIANELEQDLKPEFEVGKWYKCYGINSHGLVFLTKPYTYGKIGYGIDGSGNWTNEWHCKPITDNMQLATESEVLEALTKEAVKNYKGKKFIESRTNSNKYDFDKDFEHFYFNGNTLCIKNAGNGTLFHNGIWATVIKERSFEEWYKSFINSPLGVTEYMKSTKTELIEILKKLPND